ncbi:MAG: ParB N-terminal domain-containing protein [Desulfobacterales bacterium]|nr:ParB N-terminal domain-containing protein [Desulfobacterales bacterium]
MKQGKNKVAPPLVEPTYLPTKDLYFDGQNPRLVEAGASEDQQEILRILWREFAVDEIALSIAANGYFPYETLIVTEENGRYVVIEGNRRLAAVRLLCDPDLRKKVGATDLPRITEQAKKELENLPAIICKREDIWQHVGFKHVNGPQEWTSYSKACYIANVHNKFGIQLDDIARNIGDQHSTVKRLYRAWMVLKQGDDAGQFKMKDGYRKHFSFSHLYTGLDYPGVQNFLGISKENNYDKKRPIRRGNLKQLGELCLWLYGSRSKEIKPVIRSQNPDLRILDEVLISKDATAALRKGLPLTVARDIGKGDELLFREALVAAKQSLQEARGKLLTGYRGESDLLKMAEEINALADNIYKDMLGSKDQHITKKRG